MSTPPRDSAERLLAAAVSGLPATRAEWGAAMTAELASIDDPQARRTFARSAGGAALLRGYGIRIGLPLLAGLLAAVGVVVASRLQLAEGGPGVLTASVPWPALLILGVAFVAATVSRSPTTGLEAGLSALAACAVAVFLVLAVEGQVWMRQHGVFVLDADPPHGIATASDVVFDVFTTGMWVGHLVVWALALLIGAGLGGVVARGAGVHARG